MSTDILDYLFQVLSNQVKKGVGQFKREYKFSPQNVILKRICG